MMWFPVPERKVGIAIFSFHGIQIIPNQGIDLDLGDTVHVLQECGDWLYGYVKTRKDKRGVFPASYVQLRASKRGKQVPESLLRTEDPVVKECRSVAREWGEILKQLYVNGGQYTYEFDALGRAIRDVVDGRRQLIIGTLTQDQIRELKLRLTLKIDWKNRSLGLDLVPRIGYEVANPDDLGAIELYHIHKRSAENAESGRGTVRKKRLPFTQAVGHHLYCSFRAFSYQLNDNCEVYFSLFDAQRMQFISERFLVIAQGMSNFVDKLQLQGTTVFEDLGSMDLHPELYLVAQVIRVGKMFYSESAKKSSQVYKRPFACGVLNIGEVVAPHTIQRPEHVDEELKLPAMSLDPEDREFTFKLYTTEEKEFSHLHELLVKKQMGKVSVVSGCFTIVALKLYTGDVNTIRLENPIVFKNAVMTRKLGFPDIIYPGDVRNDIYITLDHGEFEKGGKPTGKNIEVSVLVFDDEGNLIPNSIFGAVSISATGTEEYQSLILYHHNCPKWNETIRVTVPIEKFPHAHLRIEYSHCSTKDKNTKKLFGFSFLKLIDDEGTTIKDGPHELLVYKCEDKGKVRDPQNYLALPFLSNASGQQVIGNQMFQRSTKEMLTISTLLVSTKLTQNLDLVSLLKWRSNPDKIKQTLENMTKVSGEEIVKFLQDVLDVLFAMFLSEEGESNDYSGDVFVVLVNIFVLLEQGKFEHFKPVIDAYITDHFAAALVYRGLLSTVQHYAEVVRRASKELYPQIQKCFESLEFIFKFIVQSLILFARATHGEIRASFSNNVSALFVALNAMLDDGPNHQSDYVQIQAALLHNLSKMYNELVRVMPMVELTKLVCQLFASISFKDSPHPLSPAKLTALHHLVKSTLFDDKECRGIILPELCKHLRHHLCLRQELKLCTEVLDDILIFLYKKSKSSDNRIHDDVETVAISTMEMLVKSIVVLERTSQTVANLVTCLIGLLQLMDQYHFNRLWDEFRESQPLRELLLRVYLVFGDLIKKDIFPVDWIVMKLVTDSIMLKAIHEFSQPLVLYFINKADFDSTLWMHYFLLVVSFLTQPDLQLEKFRPSKRETILQRYGDMRVQMGFQIVNMWSNLGDCKFHFIPSMVGPFLEVTLVPETELRKATLHIFYDMLEADQMNHGDFKEVESALIDELDMRVSQNKGDEEYRQLFNSMDTLHQILMDRLHQYNPPWKSTGISFINSVTRLLERLLDYRNVLQGDENKDKRMSCTVNLLDFYKTEINRQEMYMRYIYKLHDLHLSAENFTEAGFTLLLHAEKITWTSENVPPMDGLYPAQPQVERKEDIYLKVLKYFDQGKMWEKGIPLCKELANLYEFKFFNYTKLSQILKTQASFFENILTQLRPEPEYFRVGYFGKGFPLFVRNKEFIYRGLEYERLTTFIQRVLTEWPAAEMLKNVPPDDSLLNSDGQFIQICSVKPIPDANNPILKAHVPEKIQAYYNVNNVDAFSFDRRLKKFVQEDPENQNEFKNMWIERTRMRTANPLPGILRWFEVVDKKVEQITPVRYACERIEEVNRQLKCLVNQYISDQSGKNVNPLSMKLQGILDATVMGGLANYRDAFFTSDFLQNNPNSLEHVNKLRILIVEQVNILESGLAIHGKLASPQVQPLHNRLVECFAIMKRNVETDFSRSPAVTIRRSDSEGLRDSRGSTHSASNSIINTPLPPVPFDVKRVNDSTSNRSSNSSGYGQLLGSFFDQNSDEDDFYSKPSESKDYKSIRNTNSLSNANSEPSLCTPPPIPNRQRLRILQSSSCGKNNEYIFMPPNRARELCGEKQNGKHTPSYGSLDDSFNSGSSYHTVNGSPGINSLNGNDEICVTDGPPLPPRSAGSVAGDRKSLEMGSTEAPPVLPKRLPRKDSLTPRNSTDSERNVNSPSPLSPTKVGPPIPPKPKSGNKEFCGVGQENLIKDEFVLPLTESPSFEETLGHTLEKISDIHGDPRQLSLGRDSPSNNKRPILRNTSRTSHKEFFSLPFENSKRE